MIRSRLWQWTAVVLVVSVGAAPSRCFAQFAETCASFAIPNREAEQLARDLRVPTADFAAAAGAKLIMELSEELESQQLSPDPS